MDTERKSHPRVHSRPEPEDEAAAPEVVESLLLVLLGLPLMTAFALAAVRLAAWLLARGIPLSLMAAACLAAGLAGASLFGAVAAACRRCAEWWPRPLRAG